MKGTKRLGVSDSNPDTNDSAFWSKRVTFGSRIDAGKAESSQQQTLATSQLDKQRAESSRQHVMALNKQFASWVQNQLTSHPDELWEDGVQDYLAHASSIMEKFSDVVNWLKQNAARGESLSTVGSQMTEKKVVPEIKNNEVKLFQEKNAFAPASTSASFATSWSSSTVSSSHAPALFGSQSSVPLNRDASNDVDGENDLEQPSSPSVKKTEEKGIAIQKNGNTLAVFSKTTAFWPVDSTSLFTGQNAGVLLNGGPEFSGLPEHIRNALASSDTADKDPWKDKGTGLLSIKCIEGIPKGAKESKPTIVVRNDVGKVLLNALLYPGIKTSLQKNSVVAIFHTSDDTGSNESVVARTFLIRTKTQEDRNKLATAIQEHAPGA